MALSCLLAIDQGTTGSRAILYRSDGVKLASAYSEFAQYYPQPGWVEHDAEEIWRSVLRVIQGVCRHLGRKSLSLAAVAITNQRETAVLWDARTGQPACRAVVWQDRRTEAFCREHRKRYPEPKLREKTGLVFDPYFSATKIEWLLRNHPVLRLKARQGRLRFGTVDSWLLWKLTGGKMHATDSTNASRTLLYNIRRMAWDEDLLDLFQVPRSVLPEVRPPGERFGILKGVSGLPEGVPIHAVLGDQQAALYGQSCYGRGAVKNTYGTGCFLMMNAGAKWVSPPQGILVTLAADRFGNTVYALEGAVFIAGAAVQWLRDGLKIIRDSHETDRWAKGVSSSEGLTVIPAFVGLGSPHWKAQVRGAILGITRGVTRAHLIRATLESVAHQSADVLEAMRSRVRIPLRGLQVDGGMTRNAFLMQFQADLLRVPVRVSRDSDLTAWGAAKLAGRKTSFWDSEAVIENRTAYQTIRPRMPGRQSRSLRAAWKDQLTRYLKFSG